jgi:hypothetical protein
MFRRCGRVRLVTDTHTQKLTFTNSHTDHMSSTVVKICIDSDWGLADYTGEVDSDGQPHGLGSWEVFEGNFKGSEYDGTFVNGRMDGFGKFTWSFGRVDAGEFKADDLHGFVNVCRDCAY